MVSVTTTQFFLHSSKAVMHNMWVKGCACVSVQLYLQKQGAGWIWPIDYHLLMPGLHNTRKIKSNRIFFFSLKETLPTSALYDFLMINRACLYIIWERHFYVIFFITTPGHSKILKFYNQPFQREVNSHHSKNFRLWPAFPKRSL